MKRVIVLGAGKIGTSVAKLLAESGDYRVTLVDAEQQALDRLEDRFAICKKVLDVVNEKALVEALSQHDAVVSACAFNFNHGIAKAALKAGVSYFDLTEDVETTTSIRQLAQEAKKGRSLCRNVVWHLVLSVFWGTTCSINLNGCQKSKCASEPYPSFLPI